MNRNLLVNIVLALVAAGGVVGIAAQEKVATQGEKAKDAFPNGCVSCHVDLGDGKDHRLNTLLGKVATHPKLTVIKNVPNDCGMCHKPGSKMEGFNTLMHKVHYGKQAESEFVKLFGGSCLNCHALDPKTGKVTPKSGPKNW